MSPGVTRGDPSTTPSDRSEFDRTRRLDLQELQEAVLQKRLDVGDLPLLGSLDRARPRTSSGWPRGPKSGSRPKDSELAELAWHPNVECL